MFVFAGVFVFVYKLFSPELMWKYPHGMHTGSDEN